MGIGGERENRASFRKELPSHRELGPANVGLVTERTRMPESRPGDILNWIHGWAEKAWRWGDHRGESVWEEQPRRMASGCLHKTKTKKNNRPGQRVLETACQVLREPVKSGIVFWPLLLPTGLLRELLWHPTLEWIWQCQCSAYLVQIPNFWNEAVFCDLNVCPIEWSNTSEWAEQFWSLPGFIDYQEKSFLCGMNFEGVVGNTN